jgi:putative DNA primase/helicase
VCWKWATLPNGKRTKVPVNARTGRLAKANDPATWSTYQQASRAERDGKARKVYGGVGFVPIAGGNITFIDLDHCRDAKTGEIEPWALAELERFDSYSEVSPTGTGLRIWIFATLPAALGKDGGKRGNYEAYSARHFGTVTGQHLVDAPLTLLHRHTALEAFAAAHLMPKVKTPARSSRLAGTPTATPITRLDDEALLAKIRAAKNGEKFSAVFAGDVSGYSSNNTTSEARLALLDMLAFYSHDPAQLDRLMRRWPLLDLAQWERLGASEIDKAIAWTPDMYRGKAWWADGRYAEGRAAAGDANTDAGAGEDAWTATHDAYQMRVVVTDSLAPPRDDYRLTEQGNADRLLDTHRQVIRYCEGMGFLVWNGKYWQQDPEGLAVQHLAKAVVRDLYHHAAKIAQQAAAFDDPESFEARELNAKAIALLKWAGQSSRQQMYEHMAEIIRSDIRVNPAKLDRSPYLLNCANGTVDLRTGELRPHSWLDYITVLCPTTYDAEALAPRWLQFMGEIMLGREELVRYLQRAMGYTITGDVREDVWHELDGGGENGKTTFMETIATIIGPAYGYDVDASYITVSGRPADANAPSPVTAGLRGKRLVKVAETQDGAQIDASKVKNLTGGDTVTGRHLNKGIISFKPTHKIWVYTNHLLRTRDTTHGFWRRVRRVPFDLNLAKHATLKKDPGLRETLRTTEASGILAWLVRGCLDWQRDGLQPPAVVLDATEAYREQNQPLRLWLEECCVLDRDAWTPTAALWSNYIEWAKDAHVKHLISRDDFTKALAEKGCEPDRRRVGDKVQRGWAGIGLQADGNGGDDDPEPPKNTERSQVDVTPVTPVTPFHHDFPRESSTRSDPENGVTGVTPRHNKLAVLTRATLELQPGDTREVYIQRVGAWGVPRVEADRLWLAPFTIPQFLARWKREHANGNIVSEQDGETA